MIKFIALAALATVSGSAFSAELVTKKKNSAKFTITADEYAELEYQKRVLISSPGAPGKKFKVVSLGKSTLIVSGDVSQLTKDDYYKVSAIDVPAATPPESTVEQTFPLRGYFRLGVGRQWMNSEDTIELNQLNLDFGILIPQIPLAVGAGVSALSIRQDAAEDDEETDSEKKEGNFVNGVSAYGKVEITKVLSIFRPYVGVQGMFYKSIKSTREGSVESALGTLSMKAESTVSSKFTVIPYLGAEIFASDRFSFYVEGMKGSSGKAETKVTLKSVGQTLESTGEATFKTDQINFGVGFYF